MYFHNKITFRFFLSILFFLEIICVFGYSSSIFFFFIFFLIFYVFFNSLTSLTELTDLNNEMRYLYTLLHSVLNLIKYKKRIFLSFFFYDLLFKNNLYFYKSVLKNILLKIYNYIFNDFFFKYYFLNN